MIITLFAGPEKNRLERKERKQHNSMLNQVDSEGFSLGLNWFGNAMHCWTYAGVKAHYFRSWPNLGKSEGIGLIPQNCASLSKALCKFKMIRVQERSLLWFEYLSINIYLSLPLPPSFSCVLFTASCITIYIHILFPHLYLHVIWVFTELWQGWNMLKSSKMECFFLFSINKYMLV